EACDADTLKLGAAASTARIHSALYGEVRGLNMTATFVTDGAKSCSTCNHLLPMSGSKLENPVRLPPGREMLVTKPCPIGSDTTVNTIGMVVVALCNAVRDSVPNASATSGAARPSSSAYPLSRCGPEAPHRCVSWRLRPLCHPAASSPALNAAARRGESGLVSELVINAPTRAMRPCARAATGHAAAPPSKVTNSRRLTA